MSDLSFSAQLKPLDHAGYGDQNVTYWLLPKSIKLGLIFSSPMSDVG